MENEFLIDFIKRGELKCRFAMLGTARNLNVSNVNLNVSNITR